MEPLLIILVPGVLGGVVLALLIAGHRKGTPPTFVPRRLAAPSPALINMSRIQVEGLGGLGMVAAVVVVAVSDPRIRLAIIMASVLGVGLALVLIAMRRRTGALWSSGDGPDEGSPLRIDGERRDTHRAGARGTIDQVGRPGRVRFLDTGGGLLGMRSCQLPTSNSQCPS
jgi:hypothetical protein